MKKKLMIFDVDGVLLDLEEGSYVWLLKKLGRGEEAKNVYELYLRQRLRKPWGLEEFAQLFKGIEVKKIEKVIESSLPIMEGAENVIIELKERGYMIIAISSAPSFLLKYLKKKLNLDRVYGSVLEVKDKKFTGRLIKKVDRYAKARELRKLMKEFEIKKENVYVVGDSVTDISMARVVDHFIAFNPKDEVLEKYAEFVIKEKNLREILRFLK
ncbi:MAG TPA: HAD family hydrolase [Candidatus Aenigmarchaeota archaeon]|nr:HAD family hydrolase [Candidatus Aenigmarchaeota archaeon]